MQLKIHKKPQRAKIPEDNFLSRYGKEATQTVCQGQEAGTYSYSMVVQINWERLAPEVSDFKTSKGWFSTFKSRYNFSSQALTSGFQTTPNNKALQNFHQVIHRNTKKNSDNVEVKFSVNATRYQSPMLFCSLLRQNL